jgi:glucose-6-phosphate 1-epimerase
MPFEQTRDRIYLQHPRGSSVELLLYGATVISWKVKTIERLFLSSKALLDGSKPVRGGIPIVFPCFGPPTHPDHARLAQHGFARNEIWAFDSVVVDNDTEVSARLTLEPTPKISGFYGKPFHLTYVITLSEHQISTDLHVKNTSILTDYPSQTLEFQALFHNYILAPSQDILITPLQHKVYYDKTEPTEEGKAKAKVENRACVDVRKFTDSVYEDAAQKYEVTWPNGGIGVRSTELKDLVVWNPQESGNKMVDMEENGWEKFVCVEPGYVRGFVKIEPGRTWVGQQVLSVM